MQPLDPHLHSQLAREHALILREAAASTPRARLALRDRISSAVVALRVRSAGGCHAADDPRPT